MTGRRSRTVRARRASRPRRGRRRSAPQETPRPRGAGATLSAYRSTSLPSALWSVSLAVDVGYAASSWEEHVLPGLTTDDAEMDASLSWVRDFAARDDCAAAFANHDPDVSPTTVG